MRLTTRSAVTFDLTTEAYGAMMMEVRELVLQNITSTMTEFILQRVMENIQNDSSWMENLASNINYNALADYARRGVVQELLGNENFNSRLMRHIGNATIGVTTEAVERVTALMEAKTNNNGDA